MEIFGLSRALAATAVLIIAGIVAFGLFWFFHSAPPNEITLTAGPPGSSYESNAVHYSHILASNGVALKVLHSEGSLQNLQRLQDPAVRVDVGFVQAGISNGPAIVKLASLGSISYQPLIVFHRGAPVTLLSQLKGQRLAIGPEGSGTRSLALTLLRLNAIEPGDGTVFDDLEAEPAAAALLDGKVDAVFFMGDSASPQLMRKLLLSPGVELLNFSQADGYSRRITYLNKLLLPKGAIDFGKDIPSQDLFLVAPTVELLARPDLHPALCDLLIEAAQEVNGGAGLFKKKGEFPAPLEHDHPISVEAGRYYKSGKTFLYRRLPFRWASLVNRVLVVFVPMVVLLVPAVRLVPTMLGLRIKLRIYRWYRALLAVERDLHTHPPEQRSELLGRLDHLERQVNRMTVPASFADQFYALRGSIGFVRERIARAASGK